MKARRMERLVALCPDIPECRKMDIVKNFFMLVLTGFVK